jgi:2-polyprenyl-3-methyl-5-hydroxy-6-metoxy-1,4-benzoquinol methylase
MCPSESHSLTRQIARSTLQELRRLLRRIGFLRSGWNLSRTLVEIGRNTWATPARFEREFQQPDPWGYFSKPRQQERLRRAAQKLEEVRSGAAFRKALEIGCAEGAFTELLAPMCESVLAVDFSALALARAKDRCRRWTHVRCDTWDLRRDLAPGLFDLVVVMDVLEFFYRPNELRAAREKIVDLLVPGGYLLVTCTRLNEVLESAWWSKQLLRGGKWISLFLAQHPALCVVATATEDFYVRSIYRKKSCDPAWAR